MTTTKLIPGFSGFYKISKRGTIWSCRKNTGARKEANQKGDIWKEMRVYKGTGGYLWIRLRQDGISVLRTIHSLLLETFVGPCPKGMYCRHKDGGRSNNSLSNLEWNTPKVNMDDKLRHGTGMAAQHHCNAKLTNKDVQQMRQLFRTGEYSQKELAKMFNISFQSVNGIVHYKTWKRYSR